MGVLQERQGEENTSPQGKLESFAREEVKPLIATARPGLSGVESALMRRLPSNYSGKTVKDVLAYMVDSPAKDEAEVAAIASLKKELGSAGSVVVINNKEVRLTDPVEKYFVEGVKDIGGRKITYQKLEIEVSAVQQGGYRF